MYYTDNELVETQQQNLILLENQLKQQQIDLSEIADYIPGYLHLNHIDTYDLIFADEKCEDYLNLSLEEMVRMGEQFAIEYFHAESLFKTIPGIIEFGKQQNYKRVIGFTEKIKAGFSGKMKDFIGFSKVSEKLDCFIVLENPMSVFGDMAQKMNRLIDDNKFLRKNYNKFASLTKREIEIICLIGNGKSRQFIAGSLCISKHTLDNHRKHIRQKLEIKNAAEIYQYIRAFDLC